MIADIIAILSGGLVGFFLSLVGGGGSVLAVPLLLYAVGVPSPHIAIGTSAVAVTANAFLGLFSHARAGHVRWLCAGIFAAIGSAGALVGSSFGKAMDGDVLLFVFGLVMIAVALFMLRRRKAVAGEGRKADLRMCVLTGAVAVVAGLASGFFGIGGGFLIVPAMVLATGMPTVNAVGSSLLAVGAFGLATALNYGQSGLVDWVVAGEFVAGGVVGGIAGTWACARLGKSRNALNYVFAALVFSVAAYILYRAGSTLFLRG
jgi:uncharacterized membrane protein YfcA